MIALMRGRRFDNTERRGTIGGALNSFCWSCICEE